MPSVTVIVVTTVPLAFFGGIGRTCPWAESSGVSFRSVVVLVVPATRSMISTTVAATIVVGIADCHSIIPALGCTYPHSPQLDPKVAIVGTEEFVGVTPSASRVQVSQLSYYSSRATQPRRTHKRPLSSAERETASMGTTDSTTLPPRLRLSTSILPGDLAEKKVI
jgi:hypothetical protein